VTSWRQLAASDKPNNRLQEKYIPWMASRQVNCRDYLSVSPQVLFRTLFPDSGRRRPRPPSRVEQNRPGMTAILLHSEPRGSARAGFPGEAAPRSGVRPRGLNPAARCGSATGRSHTRGRGRASRAVARRVPRRQAPKCGCPRTTPRGSRPPGPVADPSPRGRGS